MNDSLQGINGLGEDKDMIEVIGNYQAYIDELDGKSSSSDAVTTNKTEGTTASDITPPNTGNQFPASDVSVSHESDIAPQTISPKDVDSVIKEAIIDSDADGLPDTLDATGKESQIEQAYDRDYRELTGAKSSVQAFLSLFAMLCNLDLSKLGGLFSKEESNSLAVMAAAGAAQVALTHSASLQNPFPGIQCNAKDIKKFQENFSQQNAQAKRKNLEILCVFMRSIPASKFRDVPELSPKQQQQMMKNFSALTQSINREMPASPAKGNKITS